jgi:bifunctional DNase/RNase
MNIKKVYLVLAMVIVLIIGILISGIQHIPQLSTEGFSRVGVFVEPSIIYLVSDCYRLSMTTDEYQTRSIQMGLEGKLGFRPTAHDIIKDILENFGLDVLMVKITDLNQGTYYAKLLIKQGNRILNLDSRPSDAIAIAVRTNASIYIKQDLLDANADKIC